MHFGEKRAENQPFYAKISRKKFLCKKVRFFKTVHPSIFWNKTLRKLTLPRFSLKVLPSNPFLTSFLPK
tara:strand:- start:205 stop:411 length:207 start_codon:yes stop_codon:yes gene_type:complete